MRNLLLILILLFFYGRSFGNPDSLLRAAAAMRSTDTNLAAVYTKIAWAYLAAGDTANTLAYLKKSKTFSEQVKFDKGIMTGNSNIALFYTKFGVLDSSIWYFSQCLAKAKAVNDVNIAAKTCSNLASACLSKGNYAEAIQYYLRAMEYLDKLNDQEKIAANYHCLGIAYYLLKDYPQSLRYYFRSMEIGQKMGKPDKTGYNYNGIGVVYKEMKQYDSALHYLDEAHKAAALNGDKYLLSHNLSDEGEVYTLQGHISQALSSLFAAIALQAANGDRRGIAETGVLLGDAYLVSKDYLSAKKYYDSARAISFVLGARDVLKNSWKGLSGAYKGMNNYAASLESYRQYADLKDTLYTEESSKQIAEMQTKYNTEKKEKENVLLQKENTIKDLQLNKEKNQKYILAISFIFLIITSAVFYNRYRLKQRNELLKERELRAYAVFQAQENEKAKLSKDLHDGVGALLSLIKLNISSIAPDGTNEKILAGTKNLATNAIKEVRGISHDLMPSALAKSGLHAALTEMVESAGSSGALDIQLTYSLTERLPPEIEGNLFRIIQEATNNIIKHAAATRQVIDISARGDQLFATISDNGKGFDKQILAKITGNGLNNIYSRVNIMKGKTDIVTGAGNGTQINIVVPLKRSGNG